MQPADAFGGGGNEQEGQDGMHEAGETRPEQTGSERRRASQMLTIALTDRGGVIGEQSG